MLQKIDNQDLYFKLKGFISNNEISEENYNLFEECSEEIAKLDEAYSSMEYDLQNANEYCEQLEVEKNNLEYHLDKVKDEKEKLEEKIKTLKQNNE